MTITRSALDRFLKEHGVPSSRRAQLIDTLRDEIAVLGEEEALTHFLAAGERITATEEGRRRNELLAAGDALDPEARVIINALPGGRVYLAGGGEEAGMDKDAAAVEDRMNSSIGLAVDPESAALLLAAEEEQADHQKKTGKVLSFAEATRRVLSRPVGALARP